MRRANKRSSGLPSQGFSVRPGRTREPPSLCRSRVRQPAHLPPQPFDLLVLLARRAVTDRVRLQRRDIEDVLFGKAAHGHDVSDIIRRLRKSFAPFVGGADQAKQLIENKSRLGYLLKLEPAEIDLV
jgi:DNA-binding response OmpR family regulator